MSPETPKMLTQPVPGNDLLEVDSYPQIPNVLRVAVRKATGEAQSLAEKTLRRLHRPRILFTSAQEGMYAVLRAGEPGSMTAPVQLDIDLPQAVDTKYDRLSITAQPGVARVVYDADGASQRIVLTPKHRIPDVPSGREEKVKAIRELLAREQAFASYGHTLNRSVGSGISFPSHAQETFTDLSGLNVRRSPVQPVTPEGAESPSEKAMQTILDVLAPLSEGAKERIQLWMFLADKIGYADALKAAEANLIFEVTQEGERRSSREVMQTLPTTEDELLADLFTFLHVRLKQWDEQYALEIDAREDILRFRDTNRLLFDEWQSGAYGDTVDLVNLLQHSKQYGYAYTIDLVDHNGWEEVNVAFFRDNIFTYRVAFPRKIDTGETREQINNREKDFYPWAGRVEFSHRVLRNFMV